MATLEAARLAVPTVRERTTIPIDHAHLARYTLGNKDLEIEVLNLFVDQVPAYLVNMQEAGSDKEWRDAAHTLKGSSRAVGAMTVADLAERAEALTWSADDEAKAMSLEMLSGAIEDVKAYIGSLPHED